MPKYTCPSCGASFNGKRCKACNYEALEEAQMSYRKPDRPVDTQQPSPSHWEEPKKHTGHKKNTKRKLPRWAIFLLILFLGWPALQLLLALLFGAGTMLASLYDKASAPAPDVPNTYLVLYADDDYTVWADDRNIFQDGVIPILVENRTRRDIEVVADNIILNDRLYAVHSSLFMTAKKKTTSQGTFYLEPVSSDGHNPARVSFRLDIWDSKSYDTILETDTLTLNDPEAEVLPIPDPEGIPVWEEAGIGLTYLGWQDPEDFPSGSLRFGMINDTDQEISFYLDGAYVNGEYAGISLYCVLPPHTVSYDETYLWTVAEDLALTSVDQIESMELNFYINDMESFDDADSLHIFEVPLP